MQDDGDLAFLNSLPYFQGLSTPELEAIQARCHRRALDAGETILLEGEPADGLYLVRRGRVRVFKISPEGREQVLIVLEPGDTFNDVPVFDGGPNPASAEAAAHDTEVHVLPTALVAQLLSTNPRVAANAARVLASRLRHLTLLVEDLSLRQSIQRVARLLLEETGRAGGAPPLTQQQMAARVGTTREVVSRALGQLERHGAISRKRGQIVAIDEAALNALIAHAGERDT